MVTPLSIARMAHCVCEIQVSLFTPIQSGEPTCSSCVKSRDNPLSVFDLPHLIVTNERQAEITLNDHDAHTPTDSQRSTLRFQPSRLHRDTGGRRGRRKGGCFHINTKDAIGAFILECRSRNLSDSTIAAYNWALGKLESAYPELPTTVDFLIEFLASQELAPESRFDIWRMLRTFYTWAAARYDAPNPMASIKRPQRDHLLPRTLEVEEIQHLFSTISNQRDLAMIMLVLDTGIRLNEVAQLRWSHIKGNRVLIVHGKGGKQRHVFIRPETRQALEGLGDGFLIWLSRQPGRRYGLPMTRSGVQQSIFRILRNAGFKPPKAGPHLLRHTYGRHFIRLGGSVTHLQRIMGHEDVSTTMIYVFLNDQDIEEQQYEYSPIAGMFDNDESS